MTDITSIIITLRNEYLILHQLQHLIEINSGYCVQFAEEVQEFVDCETISNDYFMDRKDCDGWNGNEEDVWNEKMLLEYNSPLPKNITIKDLTNIIQGYHSWVYLNGKHYDAECPIGVDSLFELPFFIRHLKNHEVVVS